MAQALDCRAMKCPQCSSENSEGKSFCPDCGTLLTPQLIPVIRTQVETYIKEKFSDQELVDIKTTEAIAERFVKWGKWFLIPATILVTLLGITLGVIGVHDVSDVHKAAQQAITESNAATKTAADARAKAQEAETKAAEAIKAINDATLKMGTQLTSAQKLSDNVFGMEKRTAEQIANANKHIEGRVSDLDKGVEKANRAIAEQQSKLLSTNELVTAMFSKGQVETFATTTGNTPKFVLYSLPATPPQPQRGAIVYMLLKSAPIYQTLQINAHIYVQPKGSYQALGNVLRFVWSDPAEGLKQYALEVSYVPDPTYHGVVYSKLSVKGEHIYADEQQLQ
jgi:hypothetical protein